MRDYVKDFDKWNEISKVTDSKNTDSEQYFRVQEIWWCSLGVNIGSEMDGKNELFERPVLIIRKISKDLLLIAPITSKIRDVAYRIDLKCNEVKSQAVISQSKTISSKRLIRRIGYTKKNIYQSALIELVRMILDSSKNETPR